MAFRALLYRRPAEPHTLAVKFGSQIYSIRLRRHRRARRYTLRIHPSDREAILTMPPRGTLVDAKDFAQRHGAWIAARLGRLPKAAPFQAGTVVPLRGVPHKIVHRAGVRGVVWTETRDSGEKILCVAGGKRLGVGQRAPRRHRQNGFAIARMNAQRVAPRTAMSSQANGENLAAMLDGERVGFSRAAIKECAKGHIYGSGRQEIDRILPYPPPREWALRKTNHLPNIMGFTPPCPLAFGPWNRNLDSKQCGNRR